MVNKASDIGPSKTQDLSTRDALAKLKYKMVAINQQKDNDIAQEMESDSKPKNMTKYIMNSYKPFEYKDTNYHTKTNYEYDEGKMLSMFDSMTYTQSKTKRLNKYNSRILEDTYNKPLINISQTAEITNMTRRSYENKLKECIKTQNQK
jgi:DNA-binding NtrC family response regulator